MEESKICHALRYSTVFHFCRNPNFNRNKQLAGNRRNWAFQRGNACTQNTSVKDVSITVPAVKKTPGNINKTNQIRDAREKIQEKGEPQDARQKIQERTQNTDARQKLTMIRSQKGPQDVRVKLEAKKQQNNQPVPGQDGFRLTRTVSPLEFILALCKKWLRPSPYDKL